MKRLVTGLLLASLLLVAGVASAKTISIYQDPNATLLVKADGSSAWLFVMNAGASATNQLYINFLRNANVDLAGSYVYKADGTVVAFTLTDTDARGWDVATNGDGTIQRFWLPADVLPYEYVVVKIDLDATSGPIGVYLAQLGYFAP
jgi:ABC-type phosphate transport system substrate-binding protein